MDELNALMASHVADLDMEVEYILNEPIVDHRRIEAVLDDLLQFHTNQEAAALFIRLLEYYKTLDADGAGFYWTQYEQAFL